jgi:hypothetical protein
MPRTRYLAAALACALFAVFAFAASAGAAITTRTVEYGPWTIPAGTGDPHPANHEDMGMIANEIRSNVAKPCTDCDIIGMDAELVYAADGREANLNTGPMLHHMLLAATGGGKSDLICNGTTVGFLGERFFAAGNERTGVDIQSLPYGYYITRSDSWNLVVDLMNWQTTSKTVKLRVTYKYATSTDATSRENVRPMWLDADGCSTDSYISVPNTGITDHHRDITAPIRGNVIGAAGHIHDHGTNVELTNNSAGEALICNSVARTGESAGYITPDGRSHVSSMSVCLGNPLARVAAGNRLRLHTIYNVPSTHNPINDAMGIMLTYIDPT